LNILTRITKIMAKALTIGQILLTLPVLQILIASYFTDVIGTHICNPEWPGHARYHNAQTLDLMVFLEFMTFYYTWRPSFLATGKEQRESLFVAALTGSAFFITGLLAPLYPGALCVDKGVESGEPGTPGNWIYGVPLALNWIGYFLAIA
jgi:hypothetical protein